MSGTNRAQRVAEEIRHVVGEALVRQDIKDPRVWEAGLVTVTHVRVTGDLRQATVFFIVHGRSRRGLSDVRAGLNKAAGFLRRRVGERLRLKFTPTLSFEVDDVFEDELRVDQALARIAEEEAAGGPAALADQEEETAGTNGEGADDGDQAGRAADERKRADQS